MRVRACVVGCSHGGKKVTGKRPLLLGRGVVFGAAEAAQAHVTQLQQWAQHSPHCGCSLAPVLRPPAQSSTDRRRSHPHDSKHTTRFPAAILACPANITLAVQVLVSRTFWLLTSPAQEMECSARALPPGFWVSGLIMASRAVKLPRSDIQQASADCAATNRCGRVLSTVPLLCRDGRAGGAGTFPQNGVGRREAVGVEVRWGMTQGRTVKDFVGVQERQRPRHVQRNAVASVVPHGTSVLAVYGVRQVASVHQLRILRTMTACAVHVMRSALCCPTTWEFALLSLSPACPKEGAISLTALAPVNCNAASKAPQHSYTCLHTGGAARFHRWTCAPGCFSRYLPWRNICVVPDGKVW